jgi:hypothetical protein
MPTARVARWRRDAPRGKRASTTVRRNERARTGRGSATLPSAATLSGGVDPPAQDSRTTVGRRIGARAGVSRSRDSVTSRRLRQEIQGRGEDGRAQVPIHAVSGRASKAREARWRGWFLKRPDESKRTSPREPASRSSSESRASTEGYTQASTP